MMLLGIFATKIHNHSMYVVNGHIFVKCYNVYDFLTLDNISRYYFTKMAVIFMKIELQNNPFFFIGLQNMLQLCQKFWQSWHHCFQKFFLPENFSFESIFLILEIELLFLRVSKLQPPKLHLYQIRLLRALSQTCNQCPLAD